MHINKTAGAADTHPAVVGLPTSSSPSSTIYLHPLPSFLLPPKNLLLRGLARNTSVQTHRIKKLGPGTLRKEQKVTICKQKKLSPPVKFRQKMSRLVSCLVDNCKMGAISGRLGDLPAHRAGVAAASLPGPKRRKRKDPVSSLGLETRLAS